MADLAKHKNESVRKLYARMEEFLKGLTETTDTIKAASPPPVTELDAQFKSSDDPKLIELRQEVEKLESGIRELRNEAHTYILKDYNTLSDEDLKALKDQFATQYKQVITARDTLKQMADLTGIEGVSDELDKVEIPSLRGYNRPTSGAASGTQVIRPRFESVHVTLSTGKEKSFKRLGDAVPWAGQDTTEVFDALLKVTGASRWQDIAEVTTVTFNDVTYTVTPLGKGNATEGESGE